MKLETLHKISYGLYVICSKNEEKINGQIANALFQVTAEPATIAVSINKQNLTHEYIEKSNFFTVSILSENTPMGFIGTFGFKSGKNVDKFKDVGYKLGKAKSPIVLDNTLACIEAKVIDKIDVGTHTIFIGRVEDAETLSEGKPIRLKVVFHQKLHLLITLWLIKKQKRRKKKWINMFVRYVDMYMTQKKEIQMAG
jgi:ferric-chelate reductase [NAD(P)H]